MEKLLDLKHEFDLFQKLHKISIEMLLLFTQLAQCLVHKPRMTTLSDTRLCKTPAALSFC